MRLIPVIDLKAGIVVRGRCGRREDYRPLESCLTGSAQPREVARAFRSYLGSSEIYLADLDAIAGAAPALQLYEELEADGFRLWLDAGLRSLAPSRLLFGPDRVVVAGLETLSGPEVLATICAAVGTANAVFSLDMKNGTPCGDLSPWHGSDAWSIACQAIEAGISRLLLLDLARVGSEDGVGTEDLARRLIDRFPFLRVTVGGGVRGRADLDALARLGIDSVLVASILHDGKLTEPGRCDY